MANHKSAKKRARQSEKKRVLNKGKMSRVRTEIKKLREFITTKDADSAKKQLPLVQSLIAKLSKTSALNDNTAARKTSRLAAQVSQL